MIRPFDLRDVGAVRALSERGVCLDTATGLIRGHHPLQSALVGYLMPGMNAPTLLWRSENGETLTCGQVRHRSGDDKARLMWMSPRREMAEAGWLPLLDKLAVEVGERGAHNFVAEVDDTSPEAEALRQAGFATYARQAVWQLTSATPEQAELLPLRPATSADALGVNTLYANLIPRLVQQVELVPRQIERGYVLEQSGEIRAFIDIRRGPQGIWLEPYLHPEVYELSHAIMLTCLNLLTSRQSRPFYVCVRRYQDWLQDVLADSGFTDVGSQAVMVKRLAVRVAEAVLKPLPAMEGHLVTPVTRSQIRESVQH